MRAGEASGDATMSTRIGRRLGPGPVFVYEWITSARRWQGYALRSVFVLGMMAAFVVVGVSRGADGIVAAPSALAAMAELGEGLFRAIVGTQLTLVMLAAPAATAGAICIDRSRGTLAHLLVTDLTDREIVLGKLASRLMPVLTMVAATLPVMELLTLLGGIDPDALLGAFLVTIGVAVLGCCLALLFSIWMRRMHEALIATYVVWGFWLLGRPMLNEINNATGWSLALPPWQIDPYLLAFAPYWRPGSISPADFWAFLAGTLSISAVLVLVAVGTVRRAGLRDLERRGARRPAGGLGPSGILAPGILGRFGPSLDFNPVLWREWHRNRPTRRVRLVAVAFYGLSILFGLMAMNRGPSDELRAWINALHISVGLLFVGVIAATSLAEERARGSLDVLMTTPLETWRIVLGKWLGAFRLVPPLAIIPVVLVLKSEGVPNETQTVALLFVGFVLSCGAAVTGLGLAMATWSLRLGRAVGLTVGIYLLVNVGWLFFVLAVMFNPDEWIMGSPFAWAAVMTDVIGRGRFAQVAGAAVGWMMLDAVIAVVLLIATLTTFDGCLGRIEGGRAQGRMSSTGIRPTSTPSSTTERICPGASTSRAS